MTTLNRSLAAAAFAAALAAAAPDAAAQDPAAPAAPDTVRRELPRLEIPEITIVGKKAITLPFARKGEIFDVPVYEAPPPDSGLLTERPPIDLPPGSLPRYEQRENPWRASAEASAGSHGAIGVLGYVDYHTQRWNLSTTGGYRRTDGHVANSEGSAYRLGGRYTALVTTDNDVLRNFRLNGDIDFAHDAYGMPALAAAGVERDRDRYAFGAGFSSVRREGLVMDFSVAAGILSVDDARPGADSGVTVTSPTIDASVTGDAGPIRVITGFRYLTSSLDYQRAATSPSLATFTGAIQWRAGSALFLKAGAEYAAGTGTDDVSRKRISPVAELEWRIDEGRKVNLWFRPGMTLASYSALAAEIPYIDREIALIPATRTVDLGGSVWYNSGMLTLQVSGEYARADNRMVVVADSGRLRTAFTGTWESRVALEGTLRPEPGVRVRFNGAFNPARERGGSGQLPMTPLLDAGAQAELDLTEWWTVSAAVRGWGERNTVIGGAESIGGAVVLDAGASTTLVPHLLLSGGARNLLDKKHQWWSGYPALGLELYVTAKARL